MSPSIIECSGRMARAMPSWATAATLAAWAFVSEASVSTTPIVVASDGRPAAYAAARTSRSAGLGARSRLAAGPEPAGGRVDRRAGGVHHHGRGDRAPAGVPRSAYPKPPLIPPHRAPVPAPTQPDNGRSVDAAASARRPNSAVGRLPKSPPRPRSKITAAGTIGTIWPGSADGKADAGRLQAGHHPVGGRQPVGAAAGQHDRMHPLDHRGRVEQIGLPGAGPAAADVHPADRAARASTTVVPVSQPSPSAVQCPISKPLITSPLWGCAPRPPMTPGQRVTVYRLERIP